MPDPAPVTSAHALPGATTPRSRRRPCCPPVPPCTSAGSQGAVTALSPRSLCPVSAACSLHPASSVRTLSRVSAACSLHPALSPRFRYPAGVPPCAAAPAVSLFRLRFSMCSMLTAVWPVLPVSCVAARRNACSISCPPSTSARCSSCGGRSRCVSRRRPRGACLRTPGR